MIPRLLTVLFVVCLAGKGFAQEEMFKVKKSFDAIPYDKSKGFEYRKGLQKRIDSPPVTLVKILEVATKKSGNREIPVAVIQLGNAQGFENQTYWVSKSWLDLATLNEAVETVIQVQEDLNTMGNCPTCDSNNAGVITNSSTTSSNNVVETQDDEIVPKDNTPASFQGCDLTNLDEPKQPCSWGEEGKTAPSRAALAAKPILEELLRLKKGGTFDCATLQGIAQKSFKNMTATTWDDYVYLNFMKENLSALLSNPIMFLGVANAAQMSAGMKSGDHDGFCSSIFYGPCVNGGVGPNWNKWDDFFGTKYGPDMTAAPLFIKNSVIQLSREKLQEEKVPGLYEGIPKLQNGKSCQSEQRKTMALSVSENLKKLFNTEPSKTSPMPTTVPSGLIQKGTEFARFCDARVSSIFGGDNNEVESTGIERNMQYPTGIPTRDYEGMSRFHTCSAMHIYAKGNDKKEMFYIPAGCSQGGSHMSGSGSSLNEVYNSSCRKMGRFSGVSIVASHVAAKGQVLTSRAKNEAGSTPVGYLGGEGGQSPTGQYVHSHIQFYSGGFRVSVSDAYCRSE